MNTAGMAGALALGVRHAQAMNISYAGAVRMRADLCDFEHSPERQIYLSETGWQNVYRRAAAAASGRLKASKAEEVVTCGWPRLKRTDYCLWRCAAAAPAPASIERGQRARRQQGSRAATHATHA
eukprot:3410815-Prymnesium_polylepis.1